MDKNGYVYADNSATTRVCDEAIEAMQPYFKEYYGNPSSIYSFSNKPREACVKKRANGLLPAACGIILLALSFVLLTWIPPGTMEGSAMLCFALGTMVLFLPGRWTSALSPAAAVWIAHMSGIQPGALRLGAAAGLIAASAAEWMLRRLASEECRGILRGLCGAAMYCLGAAACVLA